MHCKLKAFQKVYLFQVEIDVNICFCSDHLCNSPEEDLFAAAADADRHQTPMLKTLILLVIMVCGFRGGDNHSN